ncbi:hypothetical protein [Priestia taiwanensis]|uniref:Lipoprotein n=1 Tax=Priestia taiwanensis TaxID=1347902 RepID=A0A917AVV0_9BACI|nr:hypothetical protein [Priestia taiwanensis]MBM7364781.1 tetratricopeptide (TPR) repeat protein [Priestia taiwanensis]GGE79552.1 hypothetical protein GCM10007140_31450 [Priestia taiwanensis]
MKKMIVMFFCSLIILSGCGSKVYDEQVDLGIKAIDKGDYTEAINSFEKAKKEKDTDEVQNYIQLVNNLQESASALKDEKYEEAITTAEKVLKEEMDEKISSFIKTKAEEIIEAAKDSQEQVESIKKEIQVGKDLLNQQKYDEAIQTFKTVSEKEKPEQLVKEAISLMDEANTAKKQYEEEQRKAKEEQAKKEKAELEKKQAEQKTKEKKKKQQDTSKNAGTLTKAGAEDLVRKQYPIPEKIIAEYFRTNEQGDHIIETYQIVSDHHATFHGYYSVNSKTKEVKWIGR